MKFSLFRRRKIAFLFLLGDGIPSLALETVLNPEIKGKLAS